MKRTATIFCTALVTLACASSRLPKAAATLQATSGSSVQGTVQFQQLKDGSVDVTLDLSGATPGVHGFHIHDKGDCGDNGNAAGGHFNPMSMPHAAPDANSKHAGDFGNVTADADGNIRTSFTTHSITLSDGPTSAIGHAVILHANPDDLTTQPSGNAGPRIACGVVTLTTMANSMQH